MKSAAIPSVRVEPELRDQIERVLGDGESVSAFVETAVREGVQRRLDQAEFVNRGLASLASARESGQSIDTDAALRRLESRLDQARALKRRKIRPAG